MQLIGDQAHGYDMAPHHIRDLHVRDAYEGDAVIKNPVIPVEARNRRRRSTEDIAARGSESNEAAENSLCGRPNAKKSGQTST